MITIKLSESPYNVTTDNVDYTSKWVAAIAAVVAANGGVIYYDKPINCLITSKITLPRSGIPFKIIGLGSEFSRIQAQSFDDTVFEFDSETTGNIEGVEISGMGIRHTGDNTIIKHARSEGADDFTDRVKDCLFKDLRLTQSTGGSSPLLDISGCLFSGFENIVVNGGTAQGTGLKISGTHTWLEKIYAPTKSTAPSTLIDYQGTNGRIQHCRTEGGNSTKADYYIHDSDSITLRNLYAEGYRSEAIVLLENVNDFALMEFALGGQESGSVSTPYGIKCVNARYGEIEGKVSARENPGRALYFDVNSKYNWADVRITKTQQGGSTQVADDGSINQWQITDNTSDSNGTRIINSQSLLKKS